MLSVARDTELGYYFDMMDRSGPKTEIFPRVQRNHPASRRRSVFAPLLCDRHTLAARAIRWAIPWSRETFPGMRAGVREILGRPSIAWATVQGWRAERSRMPADYAERLAIYIRVRSEHGMALARELEEYVAKRRAEPRRPRGFQIVRERDGVVRDGRWRGGRRRPPTAL